MLPTACVDRAIATMRLTLGYLSPLPMGWPRSEIKSNVEVVPLLEEAFPGRTILVYTTDLGVADEKVKLRQTIFIDGPAVRLLDSTKWLMAFAYIMMR